MGFFQEKTLQLGDLKEPEPIPYSYDTLGWKIVFGVLVLLFLFGLYKWYVAYKKKQYLRDAVQHIQTLSVQTDLSLAQYINAILITLKRTAIQTFGRTEVAALHGKDWLQFLDNKVKQSNFSADETAILQAVYKDRVEDASGFSKDQFKNKSIHWITHHA
ncbi:DUF4381 domain-containing protein [Formosa sp. S-31]|uniref:DUF4381 domain-containing protein n=1 Tax=Formosa sp. S-31 TaxID=2790949 RepID=UPI003EB9167E